MKVFRSKPELESKFEACGEVTHPAGVSVRDFLQLKLEGEDSPTSNCVVLKVGPCFRLMKATSIDPLKDEQDCFEPVADFEKVPVDLNGDKNIKFQAFFLHLLVLVFEEQWLLTIDIHKSWTHVV